MRLLLIMNPGAHAGRGKRQWKSWERKLRETGTEFRCVQTEGLGHAFELARTAGGCDAVVAVGGDGTVNEVLDGVVRSGNTGMRMGVLYCGTSPDFCRFHGIPTDPERAFGALLAGKSRKVDAAAITYHDDTGAERTAHFGCSCNVGMGASVARRSNRWRRFMGDRAGTAAAVLSALMVNARIDLELEIDGETRLLPETNNLSVAKNPYLASGLKLELDLRPDDGAMWLVGLHGKGRGGLWGVLPKFYSGSVSTVPGVLVRRCRSVAVSAREPQEIEFDGDPRGYLPVRIEVVPRALNLIGGANE